MRKFYKVLFLNLLFLNLGCLKDVDVSDNKSKGKTYTIDKGDIVQQVTSPGHVYAEKTTLVMAPFNGYVKKLYVEIGSKVKENSPIVSIVQTLQSKDKVYPLRAPFSGTVVSINKDQGEYVKQNNSDDYIVRIDKLENLRIVSNIPEVDIGKIKVGQKVLIKATSILEKDYKGEILEVSLAPRRQQGWRNETKVEYKTKISLLNGEGLLPGMSVIVDIITSSKKNIVRIPHEYLLKEKNKFSVYQEDNTKIEIKVGVSNDSYYEVLSGLKVGDKIRQIDLIKFFNRSKN